MDVLMLLTKSLRHDPRVHHEAVALQEAGHGVTVLEWSRHEPEAPRLETLGGVDVERTPGTALMRRMPNDLLRTPFWWRHAVDRADAMHNVRPFDAVHAHDLDTLVPAARFARRRGLALVYDAHEVFHEMIQGHVPWPVPAAARRLEARLVPEADLVFVASDRMVPRYQALATAPVHTVWNCFAPPPDAWTPPPPGTFTVVYIGTLSTDRLFPEVVDALGGMPGVRFVFGGKREGVYAETAARANRHANVEFLGPVPHAEVLARTRAGHVVLAMLDPGNAQYRFAVANKMFDAMAAGRPVLAARGTEVGRFVEENDMGIAVDYRVEAVRAGVLALRDDGAGCRRMGENGQRLARSTFNWTAQKRVIQGAYTVLAGKR